MTNTIKTTLKGHFKQLEATNVTIDLDNGDYYADYNDFHICVIKYETPSAGYLVTVKHNEKAIVSGVNVTTQKNAIMIINNAILKHIRSWKRSEWSRRSYESLETFHKSDWLEIQETISKHNQRIEETFFKKLLTAFKEIWYNGFKLLNSPFNKLWELSKTHKIQNRKGWLKMSITLEKLILKAEQKGIAILNGRMWDNSRRDFGELREKYAIERTGNKVVLRHWGTVTLELDLLNNTVVDWYGESRSDADSMNFVLSYYKIKGNFRYRPSIDEFSYSK